MMMIDVKKPDGSTVNVELISFFEVTNINKKYLFYTLNEVIENDLIKMYVSEVMAFANGVISIGQKMTEEEWKNLKNIMKAILTGSNDENIKYIDLG